MRRPMSENCLPGTAGALLSFAALIAELAVRDVAAPATPGNAFDMK